MNVILKNLLIYVVKKLIDSKLYNFLTAAVLAQFSNDLSGPEKKAAVKEQLNNARGELANLIASTSNVYINLAIEALVAILKK